MELLTESIIQLDGHTTSFVGGQTTTFVVGASRELVPAGYLAIVA